MASRRFSLLFLPYSFLTYLRHLPCGVFSLSRCFAFPICREPAFLCFRSRTRLPRLSTYLFLSFCFKNILNAFQNRSRRPFLKACRRQLSPDLSPMNFLRFLAHSLISIGFGVSLAKGLSRGFSALPLEPPFFSS